MSAEKVKYFNLKVVFKYNLIEISSLDMWLVDKQKDIYKDGSPRIACVPSITTKQGARLNHDQKHNEQQQF